MTGHVACPFCGRPIDMSAAYCATCGTPVASWAATRAAHVHPPAATAAAASRTHPGLLAGLVIAVMLAIGAIAAVVLIAAGDDKGPRAVAAPAPPPEIRTVVERRAETAPPRRSKRYDRGAYTITLPQDWTVSTRDDDKGAFVESVWRSRPDPRVTLLVDHTPGYTGTPETGARDVREMTRRSAGYREIAFGRTRLGGRDAWRWEFEAGGERKVDYFLSGCETGYAILGTAPVGAFDRHVDDFRRAASSLRPTC